MKSSTDRPAAKPVMLVSRTLNVRATADHLDGTFYILTNDKAGDRKIVATPDSAPSLASATAIVPESKGRYIDGFVLFDDYIRRRYYHGVERLAAKEEMVGRMARFTVTPGAIPPDLVTQTVGWFTDPR